MDKDIVKKIKKKLFDHYKEFNHEKYFIDTSEEYVSIYCHSWVSPPESTFLKFKNFMKKECEKYNQHGYFYIFGYTIKV